MGIVVWWASAWTVAVTAGTAWSAILASPNLDVFVPGLALVYALQAPVLVIPTGLVVFALEEFLGRLISLTPKLELALSVGLSVVVSAAAVIWAHPQAGLVSIAVIAAGTAAIMSHSEAWLHRSRWAVVPVGCVIALVAGLGSSLWWGL